MLFRNRNVFILDRIAFFLLIIGGLAWGIIGIFGVNFIAAIFGATSILTQIIYIFIGAAAVYRLVEYFVRKGNVS